MDARIKNDEKGITNSKSDDSSSKTIEKISLLIMQMI